MTGAMYAAIAGLRTHMSNLNVIGHNIANVNTTAYKSQRAVFRTALYTQVSGGSDGSTTTGGINPSQVGYGSNLTTISKDMSTGSYAPGQPTDCMIDGDGFFLVGSKDIANSIDPADPNSLKSLTLSRTGDFEIKSDGYLCDGPGNAVYGFLCVGVDTEGNAVFSDQLVPIRLPRADAEGRVLYPTDAPADGSDMTYGRLTDAKPNADATGGGNANNPDAAVPTEYEFIEYDSFTIDKGTGVISATIKGSDKHIVIGAIALGNVTNPNGVTAESNTYYKCGPGAGDMTVALMGGFEKEIKIGHNTTGTQYNDADSIQATTGVARDNWYINGSLFGDGNGGAGGTGDAATQPAGMRTRSAGTTGLLTGGLELSKTDLATEIANMITTQRGYQANTRIVTVTDSMLEELVNMKR